jgi:hypothetical protein
MAITALEVSIAHHGALDSPSACASTISLVFSTMYSLSTLPMNLCLAGESAAHTIQMTNQMMPTRPNK